MYVRRNLRPGLIWRFSWRHVLSFTAWAIAVTSSYVLLRERGIDIRLPFLPMSTIGIAVAFSLGFKNSQAYERFWEARKVWGGIVNASRLWGSQLMGYMVPQSEATAVSGQELKGWQRTLMYRQLAWVNLLRLQLRRSSPYNQQGSNCQPDLGLPELTQAEDEIKQFLESTEYTQVLRKGNGAVHLLHLQTLALQAVADAGLLHGFQHTDMVQNIKECYSLQGMCERIKNTPFPRQHAYFSTLFVGIFNVLLPFGLISEFSRLGHGHAVWLTIPFSVLISWIFITIDQVGDHSEDPFENYLNDVPMTAICRSIEIDLREMLGETDLPERIQPINDILL